MTIEKGAELNINGSREVYISITSQPFRMMGHISSFTKRRLIG